MRRFAAGDLWPPLGYGLNLLLISVVLLLTFSRGALLLGLPVSLLVMLWLYGRWFRMAARRWAITVALGWLLSLGGLLLPLAQTERLRSLFELGPGSSGFFRLKVWQSALAMMQDHWPLGVGLNNFLYQYRSRYILPEAWQEPELSHPHNLLLDFGTRLGLGGIGWLIWMQFSFWRTAWRLYQRRAEPLLLGLMGSMAVFISHGLVDNAYFLIDLGFTFFLTVGLVQLLADEVEN